MKQQIVTIKVKLKRCFAFLNLFPTIMLFPPSGNFWVFKPHMIIKIIKPGMTRLVFANTAILKHVQPLHFILTNFSHSA